MDEKDHPFAASMNTDTDGYYAMEYQVAGQRVGDLVLTDDDVIGRWHQRSSADDFMTGGHGHCQGYGRSRDGVRANHLRQSRRYYGRRMDNRNRFQPYLRRARRDPHRPPRGTEPKRFVGRSQSGPVGCSISEKARNSDRRAPS
jgi:hypothetical protein